MPVQGFKRDPIQSAKFAHFTFDRLKLTTLARLQGPKVLSTKYDGHLSLAKPSVKNTRLEAFRCWDHTIAPIREHQICLPGHHLVSLTIPMGETPFLRNKFPKISPDAPVGSITLSMCHKKGTRLRIDLMDVQYDLEVDELANMYSVITGPVKDGFYAFIYMHTLENCQCVVAYARLNEQNAIRMNWQILVSVPLTAPPTPREAERLDGGVLILRQSWIDNKGITAPKVAYELAAETLGWQPLTSTKAMPVIKYNLCNPAAKVETYPLNNVLSFPQLESYHDWQRLRMHEAFKYPASVSTVLAEQFTAVSDNVWLGALYAPTAQPEHYLLTERLKELLRTNKMFGLLKSTDTQVTFSLMHDPMAKELIDQQLHTRVHTVWGTIEKAITPVQQSAQISHQAYMANEVPAILDPDFHWTQPLEVEEVRTHRSPPSTRTSKAGSLDMRNYQSSEVSIRLNRPVRTTMRSQPWPDNPPRSSWDMGDATNRNYQPWSNDNSRQQATTAPSRRTNQAKAGPPTRPDGTEPNPLRLTIPELQIALAGGSCPGLRPSDELIANLPANIMTDQSLSRMLMYALMRLDQQSIHIIKLQREMCWCHQRMTRVGIPREKHQYNGGVRPEATEEMADDVTDWAQQNKNPMDALQVIGRIAGQSTSSSEDLSSTHENNYSASEMTF